MNVKQKKHEEIQLLAQTKLESIQDIILKALIEGRVSDLEFEWILSELERYRTLKQELHHKAKKKLTIMLSKGSNTSGRMRGGKEHFFTANCKYFCYPECKCHISYELPPPYDNL